MNDVLFTIMFAMVYPNPRSCFAGKERKKKNARHEGKNAGGVTANEKEKGNIL